MKHKNKKYTVVEDTVQLMVEGGSITCPDCESLMKLFRNGFYEEAECVGCGYTETSKILRSR